MAEPVQEHKAVKRNAIEEVKALIKKNKNAVFTPDNYEQTMLHVASFEGLFDMVSMLLKYYKPVDLKLRDKNGWTALHCAASQGHLDIYDLLLTKGASPNAQNGDLTSPFAYLCRFAFLSHVFAAPRHFFCNQVVPFIFSMRHIILGRSLHNKTPNFPSRRSPPWPAIFLTSPR
jgi:hypothetical protein